MSTITLKSVRPRISGRTRKLQPRWEVSIEGGPTVEEVLQACGALAVAIATHPDNPRSTTDSLKAINEQACLGIIDANLWRQ